MRRFCITGALCLLLLGILSGSGTYVHAQGAMAYFGTRGGYKWNLGEVSQIGFYIESSSNERLSYVRFLVEYDPEALELNRTPNDGITVVDEGKFTIEQTGSFDAIFKQLVFFKPLVSERTQIKILSAEGRTASGSINTDTEASTTVNIPVKTGCRLENVFIDGVKIEEFNTDGMPCEISVSGTVETPEITVEAEYGATVDISNHELAVGDNTVYITVTNEKGQKARYTLLINRAEPPIESNDNVDIDSESTASGKEEQKYPNADSTTGVPAEDLVQLTDVIVDTDVEIERDVQKRQMGDRVLKIMVIVIIPLTVIDIAILLGKIITKRMHMPKQEPEYEDVQDLEPLFVGETEIETLLEDEQNAEKESMLEVSSETGAEIADEPEPTLEIESDKESAIEVESEKKSTLEVEADSEDKPKQKSKKKRFGKRAAKVRTATSSGIPPIVINAEHICMDFDKAIDEYSSAKEMIIQTIKGKRITEKYRALDNISFTIRKGKVVGVIGTNGAGKSTLLKIISGVLKPTSGVMRVDRSRLQILTLGTGFDMELTGKENVYLNGAIIGYKKEFIDKHYNEIVEFAELQDFMGEKVKNYSSGMVSRLGFAIATVGEPPDILILDEVLTVGDQVFRRKSLKRIKELIHSGSTVIMVAHSTSTIRENCDEVIWLERGQLIASGSTNEICSRYEKYNGDFAKLMREKKNGSEELEWIG